jgi:hypothetical protein
MTLLGGALPAPVTSVLRMSAEEDPGVGPSKPNAVLNGAGDAADPESTQVGYGRPPIASRFQPGRSGNPRGRRKGVRNLSSIMASTLNEKVPVTENGRRRQITKLEAAVKQLVNRAASGEARATHLLFAMITANEAKPPANNEAVAEADILVMAELARRFGKPQ